MKDLENPLNIRVILPAQDYVAKFLGTFKDFPPRQKAASFTIDQVMAQFEKGLTGSK